MDGKVRCWRAITWEQWERKRKERCGKAGTWVIPSWAAIDWAIGIDDSYKSTGKEIKILSRMNDWFGQRDIQRYTL